MSQWSIEQIGDNLEFTAVNTGDYEIFLQHNTNTSANDTEFRKYPDNPDGRDGSGQTARKFEIRTNETVDLTELNGIAFTDPITIIIDKAHVEQRNVPVIFKMKIKTTVANTTIKVRWF